MDDLASAEGLNRHGARTYGLAALAALILLMVTAAPARGQGQGKVSMNDIFLTRSATVGMVPGQTLRVTAVNNYQFQDGSVRNVKASVKVYDAASNLLYRTEEVEVPSGGYRWFDIGYDDIPSADVNDIFIFRSPGTGRIQFRFDVEFRGGVTVAAGDVGGAAAEGFPATFELVDSESGQTTLIGMLLPAVQKVRE